MPPPEFVDRLLRDVGDGRAFPGGGDLCAVGPVIGRPGSDESSCVSVRVERHPAAEDYILPVKCRLCAVQRLIQRNEPGESAQIK